MPKFRLIFDPVVIFVRRGAVEGINFGNVTASEPVERPFHPQASWNDYFCFRGPPGHFNIPAQGKILETDPLALVVEYDTFEVVARGRWWALKGLVSNLGLMLSWLLRGLSWWSPVLLRNSWCALLKGPDHRLIFSGQGGRSQWNMNVVHNPFTAVVDVATDRILWHNKEEK